MHVLRCLALRTASALPRNRLTRPPLLALAALGIAATGLVSVAPAASAQPANLPTATISRSIFLAASSGGYANLPAAPPGQVVVNRSVFLAAGTYTFGYSISMGTIDQANSRVLFLDQGTYQWHCGINGNVVNGEPVSFPSTNYLTFCELFPEVPNPVPAFLPANPATSDHLALPAGTYLWESFLTPHF